MGQGKFKKLEDEWNALTPEQIEKNFGYWALRLLFEINGNLDSLSACYREMLSIQRAKNGKEKQAQDRRENVGGFGSRS